MPTKTICWMIVIAFAQQGWAGGNVGYQLDAAKLEADAPSIDLQVGVPLKDREWVTPGIEESDYPLDQPCAFDFCGPRKFRLVAEGMSEGPSWLDDVAWPRTRQMFRPTCEVFSFGGIALQR